MTRKNIVRMNFERLRYIPWRGLLTWLTGNRQRILMYHSISENPCDSHAISPSEFKRQMLSLLSAQVISLEEGLNRLWEKRSLKNTWIITFDDALLDFYTNALPILREFGYPVSMFVPTGLVGQSAEWDRYDKAKPLMTWQQLEECQQWNVTFGSHTVNHVRLTECSDETLKDELCISLQTLQDKLEQAVPVLSYPGGYHDARVRQAVSAAGYRCGLGVSSRWGNGPESDPFQLRRQRFNP
jgi:peptidoglycan/xylan/chitin deacetylase (PgdA/CDA1 family)